MAYDYLSYRMGVLPEQLARARTRYLHLLREADRLGMNFLIDETDREFIKGKENGSSTTQKAQKGK